MLLEAGANPNLQLKLFPPYRSLRDDRGADGMLTVGTTPLLRASKAGDMATMKLLLAHGANVDLPTHQRHHAADGGGGQCLPPVSIHAAATRPRRRRSKPWNCCWLRARTSMRETATGRRLCMAQRAGAGTAS